MVLCYICDLRRFDHSSINSFYLRSFGLDFLQDSLFYVALSRLNFTMLFGVSEMKRLSCAGVLLALPLFFITRLS